jgi:hypothetical protein
VAGEVEGIAGKSLLRKILHEIFPAPRAMPGPVDEEDRGLKGLFFGYHLFHNFCPYKKRYIWLDESRSFTDF